MEELESHFYYKIPSVLISRGVGGGAFSPLSTTLLLLL